MAITWTFCHPSLALLVSRTVENKPLLLISYSVWNILFSSPSRLRHMLFSKNYIFLTFTFIFNLTGIYICIIWKAGTKVHFFMWSFNCLSSIYWMQHPLSQSMVPLFLLDENMCMGLYQYYSVFITAALYYKSPLEIFLVCFDLVFCFSIAF